MKFFLTFVLILLGLQVYAQGYKDLLKSDARQLSEAGAKCWSEGGENCISYYQKAYRLTKENCPGCIEVDLAKSYSYLEKFDSAQYYLQRANKSLKKMDYSDIRVKDLDAEIQTNTSMNFYYLGKVDSAITYLKRSIEIIERKGDKKSAAFAKINLASIYTVVNDQRSAIQSYLKTYKELKALKSLDDSRIAVLAGNLATSYHEIGDKKASVAWATKAIKLGEKFQNITAQVYGNYIMAVNLSKSQPDSALKYLDAAINFAHKSGRSSYEAKSLMVKGVVLGEMKRYKEAIECLQSSIQFMEGNPEDSDYHEAIRNLGLIANESGNYELSSKYLKDYILIKDSLNVARNQELIHEFQTKFETEKKEKLLVEQRLIIEKEQNQKLLIVIIGSFLIVLTSAIFILFRRNQKTKVQKLAKEKENEVLNAFINGEERERNRISQELHDGVASMIGVAKMNMETLPHLPVEKQTDQVQKIMRILENTHSDIRHIAHNLLPTTLQKEGLIKAVEQFANEINETEILKIEVHERLVGNLDLSIQKQLMLFRMIQELVNNVVKHSRAQNVSIVFDQNENNLTIEITDDGIGFKGEINSDSQGLFSIQQRMSSILGRFSFKQSESGNGLKAILELNLDS